MLNPDMILALVDAYTTATGASEARVATLIFKDGKTFGRLRAGGDVTTRTAARAVDWFSDHWPPAAEWPAGVPRPTPSVREAAAGVPPPAPAAPAPAPGGSLIAPGGSFDLVAAACDGTGGD